MSVIRFLVKRLFTILITMSVVLCVGYLLMHYAPGSYFSQTNIAGLMGDMAQTDPRVYSHIMNEFLSRYSLTQPVWKQVVEYIWHSITFHFGTSFEQPTVPILTQLKTAFPVSAILAVGSLLLALIVGIPLGILAALNRNSWVDSVLTTISMTGQAIPAYVLAVIFVLMFGIWIPGVFPINGWGTPLEAVLPIVCLSAGNIGVVTRYMRGSLINGLRQEHIRTAEAKGVPYWAIVWRHALRNSLTALITVIGPAFGFTVVSTVWVENIFSIPGMGTLLSGAFGADDIPLAITSVFILCLMVMGANMLVDLTYSLLDPRVTLD